MFKGFGHRQEAKKQKTKLLWGKEFAIIKNGLDEGQVASFVNGLIKEYQGLPVEGIAPDTQIKATPKAEAAVTSEPDSQDAAGARGEAAVAIEEKAYGQPAAAMAAEVAEQPADAAKAEESDLYQQDDSTLYTGEVELDVAVPVDLKMISGLYNSLQTIPELRILYTSGSATRGTIITVVLEKPILLARVLSAKLPGVRIIPEALAKDSGGAGKTTSLLRKKERKVRKHRLTIKQG
ncbi:MAG: hypothetical protein HY530_00565 [Chloroflexi bacterium]|nr:hypothetical protein [Chloroflexota bacterium]